MSQHELNLAAMRADQTWPFFFLTAKPCGTASNQAWLLIYMWLNLVVLPSRSSLTFFFKLCFLTDQAWHPGNRNTLGMYVCVCLWGGCVCVCGGGKCAAVFLLFHANVCFCFFIRMYVDSFFAFSYECTFACQRTLFYGTHSVAPVHSVPSYVWASVRKTSTLICFFFHFFSFFPPCRPIFQHMLLCVSFRSATTFLILRTRYSCVCIHVHTHSLKALVRL
jgi:hypothetical protein